MAAEFEINWDEDDGIAILGRLVSRNGTGTFTGASGEGNWLKAADIGSITRKVFDLDGADPDTPIDTDTISPASVIIDPPDTSGEIWTKDAIGINFLDDLSPDTFPTGGHRYHVEYEVVLTGGGRFHSLYKGRARSIRGS